MVRFYNASALALMMALALVACGCDETSDTDVGVGGGEPPPGALPEQSAAEEDEFSGFGQPQPRFEQPDQPNQPRSLEAPEADEVAPPTREAPFSSSGETPDTGGSTFPELPSSESAPEHRNTTESDAAQRSAAETPEN